jgi:hypothetical protein
MRKLYLLLVFVTGISFSQNRQILYGFSEIPQSLLLNPGGEVKNNGYFGIPLLSRIQAQGGLSGMSVYDLFGDDGRDFNLKLQNAIYKMNSHDFFTANQQLDVFLGGFAFGNSYEKNEYISFGLYQEFDFISYFPKDYAILALEGNQNNIGRIFDISDASARAEAISVFHIGFNKKVNNSFTFGVRGKIYSSLIDFNSINNKGTFVTVPSANNFYDHQFSLDFELKTSGFASLTANNADVAKELKKRVLFGGNLGLGFDIGFTHHLTKQWTLDASILDVGFIRHSKDVENHIVKGNYIFEGINPIFSEAGEGQTAEEYWNEIGDAFIDLFTVKTETTKYTTWRPVKLNASLNYAFGKKVMKACNCIKEESDYQNAVGMQLYAIKRPKAPQLALTAYYFRHLFNGLSAKATYTIDSYSFKNIGLGISTHIGRMNFYLMADNFLEYKNIYNAQSVSLQLGFNYIFNKNED